MKFNLSTVVLSLLITLYAANISAGEVCKVSMMGRVCYDDPNVSAEASAQMKADAAAEAKKIEAAKTATNDVKK